MDFGIPFLLETPDLEDCAALCARLGLRFVELNQNFPQCQPDRLDPARLRALAQRYGIYFTIHLDEALNVCGFDPLVREAWLESVRRTILLARAVEAPIVNMHLAQGVYLTLPHRREYLFAHCETEYRAHLLAFRDVCAEALAGSGTRIAVENTVGFQPHEQRGLELLLERDCFGLTLDIGHSAAAGNADLPFYGRHKARLLHMHAHDARGEDCHLPFGEGRLDLRHWLGLAQRSGARVVLEVKTLEALRSTVSILPKYL